MKLKQFIFASMAMLWSFVSPVLAEDVAKIGETTYATLAEAFAAATEGQTITMINDIQLTEMVTIPEGKELTLDLNGKTVNSVFNNGSETNHIYALSNKGTLTIEDSKGNGSINSRGIYNYGSLTLNAGAINAIDGNGGYAVNNQKGSTFEMNGGVVAATNEDDHQSSSGGYDATALKVPSGCTATLNGGTINNVCDFTYAIDAAGTLNIPATSTITVNGTHGAIYVSGGVTTIDAGTFQIPADNYSRTDNVLYVSGGSLVVNGGTFIGDSDAASGGSCLCDEAGKAVVNGGTFKGSSGGDVWGTTGTTIKGGTFENLTEKEHIADGYALGADGTVVAKSVAKIGETTYETLEAAFVAATEGQTITLLADATPALTSQRAITKAAVIDLGGKTLTLKEDDLYFGTTTFQNGTIVVDPSVKPSTAVFWMFANQTLTFDNVKIVATGVTGTYLIGLDGNNSDLNILNGSEILVDNTTALDLDIICVNASTGNDIKVENSKVNVTNLDGRVFFRGNYTVKNSEVNLAGITKAGFRIEAGQTLSIEGTSKVTIEGEPRDGGIHLTDATATYTKAETATVTATVNSPVQPAVAKIGETPYATLADALAATKNMTGEVTVEILDKVTFNQPLIGNYSSIHFVGKADNAEMYLDVQGYTTATGKEVAFTDLKLSKSVGGYVANAGFMNVAFGIYDVKKVTYNNCAFLNGACASSGDVTFNGCTFYRSHDRYGLWAYGAPNVTVDGCTFADIRGIKLWDEGKQKLGALTVKNTNFSAVTDKPAIVLTSGKSVTLEGNTYNATKGALELDLDGNPNGTPVTSDVAPTCVNDNGACGVLVDGKIYTTVAQAKDVATATSTVTLLHNSAETVEFPEGVTLDKNGFEAPDVTVAESVELPEVVVTDIKNSLTENDPDLTFALNFAIKDVENLTDEYLEKLFAKYGDWYTDYVLTISGLTDADVTFNANGGADGYLAGQYDAWSENWVSVPFEDVTIANGQGLYIMEYAAKLMGKQGLRFTLAEVAEIVQNFDCGVYFTPEFLAANPNMQVNLQLKVFTEDADGNKIGNIDVAEREFTAAELQENELIIVDGQDFDNVSDKHVDTFKYTRTFANSGVWNAMYLPVAIPMSAIDPDKYEIAYINDVHSEDLNGDGQININQDKMWMEVVKITNNAATLTAYGPYVIKAKTDEAKNFELTLENVTVKAAEEITYDCSSMSHKFNIQGTCRKRTKDELAGGYVVSTKGGWVTSTSAMKPFRFYMTITDRWGNPVNVDASESQLMRIKVRGEEDTTEIDGVECNTNGVDQIFDLQGRRVATPVKGGIYIVNGKKVLLNK